MSRSWLEQEVEGLQGNERAIAKLALALAKASYQIDDQMIEDVIHYNPGEENFIRILAWSSFTAARYIASRIGKQTEKTGKIASQSSGIQGKLIEIAA